ncbi:chemotaxis protein CheW [Desulfocicer niacini]
MKSKRDKSLPPRMGTVTTFYVGTALCGIDILTIQEVNKLMDITPVPLAQDYVAGIINLRGKIVTVIDLGKRLGLFSGAGNVPVVPGRNVIVHYRDELIGLMVTAIGEAIAVDWNLMDAPPGNLRGVQGNFFKGVIKQAGHLIGVLDLEAVLS